MHSITIESEDGSRLILNIMGYEREPIGHFHDSNWVMATIEFSIGHFIGKFNLSMMNYEFATFRDQLIVLYNKLSGIAELDTLEGQIKLEFSGNGRGGINLNGALKDRSGDGNVLNFNLKMDQTYLSTIIDELNCLLIEYPVIK